MAAKKMTWRKVKDKWVISKGNVYFSLSSEQELWELERLIEDMINDTRNMYQEDARK